MPTTTRLRRTPYGISSRAPDSRRSNRARLQTRACSSRSALQEATEIDHRYGRIMNPNLPLGVKGMGELGMVGIPAAIANAVFHATGKRIRELPITPDKLL